jgi:hypothetical protein
MLSRLPLAVAAYQGSGSVLALNAPFVFAWLMRLAMVGILASALVNASLLPPAPGKYRILKILMVIGQWILLPITLIVFGSLPAIDAQTRLMLGKYLGFWSTEKVRKQ